jgi:ATP-dependent DNA helicase RecG
MKNKKIISLDLADLQRRIFKAVELEEDAQFINLKGHNQTFSAFMVDSLEELEKNFTEIKENKLKAQFEFYPLMDLISRIELIKNTKLVLIDLKGKQQREITLEKEKKTFTDKPPYEIEVKWVPGVGDIFAKQLARVGVFTVQDLLFYWPKQHLNFKERVPIRELEVGQQVTIVGQVLKISDFTSSKNGNLNILNAKISDGTGVISLNRFIAGRYGKILNEKFKKQFPANSWVIASGTVRFDKGTKFQLANFTIESLGEADEQNTEEFLEVGRIVPVYTVTEGLTQIRLRKAINAAVQKFLPQLEETLPVDLIEARELLNIKEAVKNMHFPCSENLLDEARKRVAFEEFFFIQMPQAITKIARENADNLPARKTPILTEESLMSKLLANLPFQLTNAQRRVFNEVLQDLSKPVPMNRLVQGDVGSGKTVVALLAMLLAVEKGQQAALMAPTEILAEQHYRKFQEWLLPIGVKVGLLIGSQKAAERREMATGLLNGQIQIAVGTHALIQDGVEFKDLGLIVIDEQHRFGVKQRELLKKKSNSQDSSGQNIDCLYMTATPIPRTLAIAMYGSLDLSEIDELPPGRKAIKTKVVSGKNRRSAYEFIRQLLDQGRQAYIVYPLIEESEALEAKAVTKEAEKIREIFPEYEVGIIHGKIQSKEKDALMDDFRANKIQILVATTVIEVGVDVPNATVMVIENSERFGLAQLHQLRGRVGRGAEQSYCLLFAGGNSQETVERMKIMEETNNGFIIAQKDMEIRGPGELIGTRQSGISDFALASLITHGELLPLASSEAFAYIKQDPQLKKLSVAGLKKLEISRKKAELIESG